MCLPDAGAAVPVLLPLHELHVRPRVQTPLFFSAIVTAAVAGGVLALDGAATNAPSVPVAFSTKREVNRSRTSLIAVSDGAARAL